jgi:hypothetical protein
MWYSLRFELLLSCMRHAVCVLLVAACRPFGELLNAVVLFAVAGALAYLEQSHRK